MKTTLLILGIVFLGIRPGLAEGQSSAVAVVERGTHFKVLEQSRVVTDQRGQQTQTTSRYRVVGNGLHYRDANGQWQESLPVIQDHGDSIVCTGATYRVILNANLNTAGAVDLETSDRKRMVSNPLGIAFYDPESGQRVFLAQMKDCQGELVSSNQVVFRDAFEGSGIEASVTYGYRRGRFSQDVTFVRGPSVTPADYGIGDRSRLEILTELLESPPPTKTVRVMKRETDELKREQMVEPDLVDEQLDYGEMAMFLGWSFSSGSSKRSGVPVAKRLLNIDGRTILAEAVEWRDVRAKLEKLPRQASTTPPSIQPATLKREIPKRVASGRKQQSFAVRLTQVVKSRPGKSGLASLRAQTLGAPTGFVLDYELVETADDVTFASGQTYWVQDDVTLGGLTTLESGAVIKSDANTTIVLGDVACSTTGAKTILTASDDSSVGQQIGTYTGPITNYYATEALRFEFPENDFILENMDIRHAWTGVSVMAYGNAPTIYRSRLGHCGVGVSEANAFVVVDTVQMCNVTTWFAESGETGGIDEYDVTENCDVDLDGDGMLDSWEITYFGNLNQTGSGDYDGDGMSNLTEYLQGRNPTVGAVSDSSNLTKLNVFTPLK